MNLATPAGIASYPHLNTPDDFQGKQTYKTDIRLDASDPKVQAWKEKVDAFAKKAQEDFVSKLEEELAAIPAESKNPKDVKKRAGIQKRIDDDYRLPYSDEYDDEGQPTGNILFRCKSNASFFNKSTNQTVEMPIKFYDANGGWIKQEDKPMVSGGAKIAAINTWIAYPGSASIPAGISARIKSIQVIELSGGHSGNGGDSGFETYDNGYVAPAATSNVVSDPEPEQSSEY